MNDYLPFQKEYFRDFIREYKKREKLNHRELRDRIMKKSDLTETERLRTRGLIGSEEIAKDPTLKSDHLRHWLKEEAVSHLQPIRIKLVEDFIITELPLSEYNKITERVSESREIYRNKSLRDIFEVRNEDVGTLSLKLIEGEVFMAFSTGDGNHRDEAKERFLIYIRDLSHGAGSVSLLIYDEAEDGKIKLYGNRKAFLKIAHEKIIDTFDGHIVPTAPKKNNQSITTDALIILPSGCGRMGSFCAPKEELRPCVLRMTLHRFNPEENTSTSDTNESPTFLGEIVWNDGWCGRKIVSIEDADKPNLIKLFE